VVPGLELSSIPYTFHVHLYLRRYIGPNMICLITLTHFHSLLLSRSVSFARCSSTFMASAPPRCISHSETCHRESHTTPEEGPAPGTVPGRVLSNDSRSSLPMIRAPAVWRRASSIAANPRVRTIDGITEGGSGTREFTHIQIHVVSRPSQLYTLERLHG